MAVKNETWIIAVIVLIAGVLIALSFTKSKGGDLAGGVPAAGSIKPDHTTGDMRQIAATRPASAVVEVSQVTRSREAFAVQVFSFKDQVRADAALRQLKEKGYPAYTMMSDLGPRGVFYRVRVGSFATEDEAKKSLEAVTRDFKSGIIVSE